MPNVSKRVAVYIASNTGSPINYSEGYRAGERISSCLAESPVNAVISKRFTKRRQIQWRKCGAPLLLHIRTRTLDGTLRSLFVEWNPASPTTIWRGLLKPRRHKTPGILMLSGTICRALSDALSQWRPLFRKRRTRSSSESVSHFAHGTRHGIYVARTDASQRRIRNETAMIEPDRNSGLDVIIPGNLSFEHQVAAFTAATLVVGAHGAGLSNIAYCSPGTIIYELVPSPYPNPCFRAIANQNNLIHWADTLASDGDGPSAIRDWDVDLTALGVRLLEQDANLAGRS